MVRGGGGGGKDHSIWEQRSVDKRGGHLIRPLHEMSYGGLT